MRAARPLGSSLIDQLDVGLVDEGRRVERVIALPVLPLPARPRAQLFINEGKQFVDGGAITDTTSASD